MTCKSVMVPPAAQLAPGDTVAAALARVMAANVPSLPVVDEAGRLAGVFGLKEVIGLLLPRAAKLGGDLGELNYLTEGLDDLKARLGAQAGAPVREFMSPHGALRAETSLMEALLLIHRGESLLPVADDTGRLVGVVTAQAALARISETV